MDTGKVVLSVLAGIAAGALLGVLFAPDKGSETRKKIAKKGSDAMDEIKDKYDEILKAITDKLEEAKEEASNLFEHGKDKTDEPKTGMKATVS
jgi:gas vesicle protein